MGDKVKVLFIMGTTRCGSTIVENVLGSIPGYFPAGEIHMLWRGMAWGFRCGCGAQIALCPIWSGILSAAGSPNEPLDVYRWQLQSVRMLHTPWLMTIRDWPTTGHRSLDRYVGLLRRLYPEVARIAGSRVVIDSSKTPSAAIILSHLDEIELYLVHLVRDPRGVAYSWRRGYPGGRDVPSPGNYRPGPIRTSARWIATNILSDAVGRRIPHHRRMLLRYEDFVARPRASVRQIARLVGEEPEALPFASERVALLEPNHCVSGNRSRFSQGAVELRLDDEWRTAPGASRSLVTALSLPWLGRYGYAAGV